MRSWLGSLASVAALAVGVHGNTLVNGAGAPLRLLGVDRSGALISAYDGTPTAFGIGFRDHLAALAATG